MAEFLIKGAIIVFGFIPLGAAVLAFLLGVLWLQVKEAEKCK